MSIATKTTSSAPPGKKRQSWNVRITVIIFVVLAGALGVVVLVALESVQPTSTTSTATTINSSVVYPTGRIDLSEPSGLAPPGANSLPGYTLSYVNDFTGTTLPAGWESYSGVPGGDPGGQFATSHVVVKQGMLELNTWKDPLYNDKWVTGGLSQAGVARTYGAYFVRSRVTGVGPNEVELLWPADNSWPPEIDFNEAGRGDSATTATIHWSSLNHIEQHSIRINLTSWHTWGVVWTPTSVTYVVDGHEWAAASSPAEVPHVPMTLDFEQRSMCSLGFDCPTVPESMTIDWVAEYAAK